MRRIYHPIYSIPLTLSFLLVMAISAQAGFEWAPAATAPKAAPPVVIPPSVPAPHVDKEPLQSFPVVKTVPTRREPRLLKMEKLESDSAATPLAKPVMKIKTITPLESTKEPAKVIAPIKPKRYKMAVDTLPPKDIGMDKRPQFKANKLPPPHQQVRRRRAPKPLSVPPPMEPAQDKAPTNFKINPYPINKGIATLPSKPTTPQTIKEPSGSNTVSYQENKNTNENFQDIMGFGSDMPLALALRQVVPAEYSFSFGPGVNAGYRVSWNGGRPWNKVASDMIAPLGLSLKIRPSSVRIEQADGTHSPTALQKYEPSGGQPKRTNIIDPGEIPGGKIIEGIQSDGEKAIKIIAPVTQKFGSQSGLWEAKQGASLKTTLNEWSKRAGVALIWNAAHDYTLNSNVLVNGRFSSAVTVLFAQGLDQTSAPSHNLLNEKDGEVTNSLTIEDKSSTNS